MNIDEKAERGKSRFSLLITDTILIAILPFLSYLYTFIFQAGYFKVFEIPNEFISISLTDMFNIGSKVACAFLLILFFINFFSLILPKGKIPYFLFRRFFLFITIFIISFPSIFLFEKSIVTYLLISFIVIILFIMFVPPLWSKKYSGTYLQKMEKMENKNRESPWEGTIIDRIVNYLGFQKSILLSYFLISIYITYNAGKATALNQQVFQVLNTSPQTVALLITNDKIISVPFDKTTRMLKPEYYINNINSTKNLIMHLENLGHLKLITPTPIPTITPTINPCPTFTLTKMPLATSVINRNE